MKIFAANWKLHKTPKETREFLAEFAKLNLNSEDRKIVFFPPATSLEACAQALQGSKTQWGSQNSYFEGKGAFTGEISAQVVKELGGRWVLLGHSERRKIFAESDKLINQKLRFVQSLGLAPMLCIGETLEERESGMTNQVIETQLENGLAMVEKTPENLGALAIAYEPVWAIGTGKVATSAQVGEAHAEVHRVLLSQGFLSATPILYGGSVKADNAKELIRIPHVGGFLVGGASLEVKSFAEICASI
jgi:triosephosphate isomerase